MNRGNFRVWHWDRADSGIHHQLRWMRDRVCQDTGKMWRNDGGSRLDYKNDGGNTTVDHATTNKDQHF